MLFRTSLFAAAASLLVSSVVFADGPPGPTLLSDDQLVGIVAGEDVPDFVADLEVIRIGAETYSHAQGLPQTVQNFAVTSNPGNASP